MKVFHRQLFLSLLFLGLLFGSTVYFSIQGLHSSIDNLTEQSAQLLAEHLKTFLADSINTSALVGKLSRVDESQLRQVLLKETGRFQTIEDVFVVDSEKQAIFSLNATPLGSAAALLPSSDSSNHAREVKITKRPGIGAYECAWIIDAEDHLYGVLRVRAETGSLRSVLHNVNLKLYLIGFAGVIGAIALAMMSSRVSKSPLHQMARAMETIDKRRYSFRLKWNKDDEFADVYQKANLALQRLEQLDTAQRTAVQRRTAVLNELRTISRFMDIMSHEIKNPLHALGINLDVLKTKIDKGQPRDSTLKHIQILEDQLHHLQEVVQGFLSYVRPGVPKKEKSAVNELIKHVCEMAAADAEKAKIRIETRLGKGLHDVVLDRNQVQQAVHNIVINAIHATGEGGKITIRSWEKRDKVLVAVKDTGVGIGKDQLKKIFDLYYTTKKNGTGLGLPVSKRIVEANDGQLLLESVVGKGTTVTFMFPAM
ncbi:MAG TPA: HAMP domain-containing sensor histidine kinase [bacterium]